MEQYLQPTEFFDFQAPIVQDFVAEQVTADDVVQQAIQLYIAVRDKWLYTSSIIHLTRDEWKVSNIMPRKQGHCLDKSSILIACLRSIGIPARLHLAKVRNHIAAEKLIKTMGTDELTPHGMVDIYLNNQWLKVSPAFNKTLCDKLNVEVLGFDGYRDSIFQEFDREGGLFMEYLEDYGHFDDLPLSFIYKNMTDHYEGLFEIISGQEVLKI